MSEQAWVSIIKLAVWIVSIEVGVITAYFRLMTTLDRKEKERSVGAEALKKQNEQIETLKVKIDELKKDNQENWATFYKIQSQK